MHLSLYLYVYLYLYSTCVTPRRDIQEEGDQALSEGDFKALVHLLFQKFNLLRWMWLGEEGEKSLIFFIAGPEFLKCNLSSSPCIPFSDRPTQDDDFLTHRMGENLEPMLSNDPKT